MKAVLCPVCGGSGKVIQKNDGSSMSVPLAKDCHGCNGKGWVEVREDSYTPYYPQLPWYPWWPDYYRYPVVTWY